MKIIKSLSVLAALLVSCLGQELDVSEPKGEAFTRKIPKMWFEDTSYVAALEFFRVKATEFLQNETTTDAVVVFEYQFSVAGKKAAKLNTKVDYKAEKVSVQKAMAEVLPKFGLAFEIVSPTKVVITDAKQR